MPRTASVRRVGSSGLISRRYASIVTIMWPSSSPRPCSAPASPLSAAFTAAGRVARNRLIRWANVSLISTVTWDASIVAPSAMGCAAGCAGSIRSTYLPPKTVGGTMCAPMLAGIRCISSGVIASSRSAPCAVGVSESTRPTVTPRSLTAEPSVSNRPARGACTRSGTLESKARLNWRIVSTTRPISATMNVTP